MGTDCDAGHCPFVRDEDRGSRNEGRGSRIDSFLIPRSSLLAPFFQSQPRRANKARSGRHLAIVRSGPASRVPHASARQRPNKRPRASASLANSARQAAVDKARIQVRRRIERTPEWEGLRIEERGWTIAGISLNPHSSILAPRCRERGGTQGGTQSFSRDGNQRDTLSALRSSSASKAGLRMEERGLRGISLDPHSSILAPFRANPRRRRRADPEDALRRRNAKSPPVESGREPASQRRGKKRRPVYCTCGSQPA